MMPTSTRRLALATAMTLLTVAVAMIEQTVSATEESAPARKTSVSKGRHLPAHYRSVVNEKQRQDIYKIQEEYEPRIRVLQDQLNALKKERDEKISALLTAEQRRLVKEAAAWSRQKSKIAQPTEPAKEATSPPPEVQKPAK